MTAHSVFQKGRCGQEQTQQQYNLVDRSQRRQHWREKLLSQVKRRRGPAYSFVYYSLSTSNIPSPRPVFTQIKRPMGIYQWTELMGPIYQERLLSWCWVFPATFVVQLAESGPWGFVLLGRHFSKLLFTAILFCLYCWYLVRKIKYLPLIKNNLILLIFYLFLLNLWGLSYWSIM